MWSRKSRLNCIIDTSNAIISPSYSARHVQRAWFALTTWLWWRIDVDCAITGRTRVDGVGSMLTAANPRWWCDYDGVTMTADPRWRCEYGGGPALTALLWRRIRVDGVTMTADPRWRRDHDGWLAVAAWLYIETVFNYTFWTVFINTTFWPEALHHGFTPKLRFTPSMPWFENIWLQVWFRLRKLPLILFRISRHTYCTCCNSFITTLTTLFGSVITQTPC